MRRLWPLAFLPLILFVLLISRRKEELVDVPRPRPAVKRAEPAVDVPSSPPRRTSSIPRLAPRTAFERLIDALRAKDRARAKEALEDLRLAFLPDPVPDAENAALIYTLAFERLEAIPESEEDGELIARAGPDLTLDERARLAALLEERKVALALLREAAKRPRCDFKVKYEDGFTAELPHIVPLIKAGRLLRAEAALGGGDPAASLRLAEAVADEPLFISQLVRGAAYGFAADAMEFADTVPRLPAPESLRAGLERSLMMELYAGCKALLDGNASELEGPGGPIQLRSPDDPLAADDLAHYGESLRRLGELAARPYWESREALELLQAERTANAPSWAQLSRLALPALSRAAARQAEAEARLGTSTIAAALRAYRDAQGQYPQSLEALGALPLDPFTGRPYLYKRDGAGFVVWSVGEDRLDGGGASPQLDPRFRMSR